MRGGRLPSSAASTLLGGDTAHVFAGLPGDAGGMRARHHVIELQQRMIGRRRLFCPDVEAGAGDFAGAQRVQQRVLVVNKTARGGDEKGMRLRAAVDLGFLHVILSELAPEIADNPERPRATNAAAQSEYAQLAGMSLAELTAAMKPYLPIVRTFVVLGDVVPSLRERLIQRIEAGLRAED